MNDDQPMELFPGQDELATPVFRSSDEDDQFRREFLEEIRAEIERWHDLRQRGGVTADRESYREPDTEHRVAREPASIERGPGVRSR